MIKLFDKMNKEIIAYQSLLDFEKSFHYIEKKILIYIYHKHIKKHNTTIESNNTTIESNNTTIESNNTTIESNNTTIESNNTLKYESKNISEKEFITSILKPKKPRIISQNFIINKDIKSIIAASDLYEESPEDYPSGYTEYGYPDSLRCNYIIWRKNNFHRCQKKISETDDSIDYCKLHSNMDNPYEDDYRKIYLKVYKEMKEQGEIESE